MRGKKEKAMESRDKQTFFEIMAGLSEIYDREISKASFEIYWEALNAYPLDKVKKAVNHIVATHKFPGLPKPAEFIEFINPPEDLDARAEMAVNELLKHLASGGYFNFEFDDPVLAATINHLGGFHEVLCRFPKFADQEREQIFWLKDFKQIYKIYARRIVDNIDLHVKGTLAIDNQAKGYLTDERGNPVIGEDTRPVMLDSPEGQKYLEAKKQNQLPAPADHEKLS
jgi:hypothetical protein